ncbi:hypothetical protein BU25DRAFT_73993 [Macroventuria anomochaeta]|uniref:Uncharacterized protein n=1 Tax=Macroventuria anomochaeta TaxID=301207 RepID=A0ACB6S0Y7_9PLEO|nr:uncharacterized protein BU25DRAFT_73993 [Macroventuria anomochaeta]KAF2626859.1 hypothetical protein BU25DRAFT_73993 [Macroventuria anomochaeta]
MDERMQTLKQKNEERLIEANQVLAYLERRSENIHQQPTVGAEPNRLANSADENAQVPIVYAFRTPDEESKVYDDESDDTDVDSIVGNSSGSSVSSLVSRAHRARLSRNKIEGRHGRRTGTGLVERVVDESVNRVYSGSESVIGGGGLSHNLPERTEHGNDGGPNDEPVNHTPEARTEHDMVGEVIALRRDLSILKRQIVRKNKSWLGQTLCSTYARWKTQLREVPRPGTQRLEWTCECGDEMFADLPVENGAQYQQMLEFLTRPAPKTQPTSQNRTTPSQLEGGTAQLNYTSLQLSQSSIGQSNAPASTVGSGNTYVGSGNSQAPTAQQNGLYVRNKYLELCVDVGKYETKLAEIQVASSESNGAAICTDAHLFRQIYHRYFALRKHTWRRFLYRPAGIKFVHFGVQAGYRVSFFSSDPLPSEEIIASKQYEYNLQPPVPPPMDSRTFLHYFYKHNAHSQSTSAKYVSRLPKKLGDSLTRSLGVDELLEGWGIHIIEGPNKVAICWALMVVLVASFGVSIGYDLITQSGDSGFAIGQWMVAALTVGLSALYFSLEDDVSSNFD